MNRRRWILLSAGLAMMAIGSGFIVWLRAAQTLGAPGVRVAAVPGTKRVEIVFPDETLGRLLIKEEATPVELGNLPKDTTIGRRLFLAEDGFGAMFTVVLMGADRTSIHRPQICLTGQGWSIDSASSEETSIAMEKPHPYLLPVQKLVLTKEVKATSGGSATHRAVFVYWFVAEDRLTNQNWERMLWMAGDLVTRGVLQRWAYVACYSICLPGQEDATYERLKEVISATTPGFQVATAPGDGEPGETNGGER